MAERKTIKKIIAGIAALAVVGLVAYGANLGNKQVAAGNEALTASNGGLFPIRTISQTACGSTPWIVTDQLGFFKEEGLQVVYTGDTQSNQIIPSIINGSNDVSDAHPNTLAVAIAGGAKIKGVVRSGIDPTPDKDPKLRHMNWYINPAVTPDVHTFADLNKLPGQVKFSLITTNQCSDFLGNSIADKNSVPRSKIEWVTMPDVQAVQALKQGLVTVSGVHPPFYKSMEDAGMVKIADSLDAGVGVSGGIGYYYFTTDFIEKHPDIIQKFARAITKGQRWANDHPEEARKMTEDWIHVPVNATHYYATDTKIVESEIDPWLADLEQAGVLPKGKIKSSDLVIHAFDN